MLRYYRAHISATIGVRNTQTVSFVTKAAKTPVNQERTPQHHTTQNEGEKTAQHMQRRSGESKALSTGNDAYANE